MTKSQESTVSSFWSAFGGFLGVVATMAGLVALFGDRLWIPRDTFDERIDRIESRVSEIQMSIVRMESRLVAHPPSNMTGRRAP